MQSDLAEKPEFPEEKSLLRFMTCGSVDDGKSTLIGRMLYESKAIYADQYKALEEDSRKYGTAGNDPDFALLVDGLSAEREQGITIDVAYRYFSTEKRKFVVLDAPGHEQYTRNTATGASNADLAIVIVDAQKGIQPQTRRHSMIISMLGVRHIILAINKIDLIFYSRTTYDSLEREYRDLARNLGFETIHAIPLSALKGDNVAQISSNTPWYHGPSLLSYLDNIAINRTDHVGRPFRMSVQAVSRPHAGFRGFFGQIASGSIAAGDDVIALPSGKKTKVKRIVTYDGDLERAQAGKCVVLTLAHEIDISRGDVLSSAKDACEVTDIAKVMVLWMSEKEMITGRQYTFRSACVTATCTLNELDGQIDITTYEHIAAKSIKFNEIGLCSLFLDRPVACEPYAISRELGSFILIDRMTNETVAMGMINHAMRRSQNVHEQKLTIDRQARACLKGQKPCVIWMTGLSGSGKSTIANLVEKKLWADGKHTIILDGDNVRRGLNRDLGFTEQGRVENMRRVAEVSKLMMDAGLITIVSLISPFRAEREMAKEIIGKDNFIEVFIDTPLHIAEERDVKGLYKKARAGEIPNFTGIDSPYEPPQHSDLHLQTATHDAESQAEKIVQYLKDMKFA